VASGKPLPPLAGVPVAIKDVISTRGIATTCGSKILENYVPPFDATTVERLEVAGAVILGKTNCDGVRNGKFERKFRLWAGEEILWRPTMYREDRAEARQRLSRRDLAVASLGTDTGGSIRQPGSFWRRPRDDGELRARFTVWIGRVLHLQLDRIGPFATNVKDVAAISRSHSWRDPHDSTSATAPVPDYGAQLGKPVKGMRLGIPKEYFAAGMDAGVQKKIEAGIEISRSWDAS